MSKKEVTMISANRLDKFADELSVNEVGQMIGGREDFACVGNSCTIDWGNCQANDCGGFIGNCQSNSCLSFVGDCINNAL